MTNRIRRAFAALPPKLRVVATLALGVPIGTGKSRLFRATRDLRERLTRVGIQV